MYLIENRWIKYFCSSTELMLNTILDDGLYRDNPTVYRLIGNKFTPMLKFTYEGILTELGIAAPENCDGFVCLFWDNEFRMFGNNGTRKWVDSQNDYQQIKSDIDEYIQALEDEQIREEM